MIILFCKKYANRKCVNSYIFFQIYPLPFLVLPNTQAQIELYGIPVLYEASFMLLNVATCLPSKENYLFFIIPNNTQSIFFTEKNFF